MKYVFLLTFLLISCSHNKNKSGSITKFDNYVYPYIKELMKDTDVDENMISHIKEHWLEINYDYVNDDSPTTQCIYSNSISDRIFIINIKKWNNVRKSFILSEDLKKENRFGYKKFHNRNDFYRYLLMKKGIINCLNSFYNNPRS